VATLRDLLFAGKFNLLFGLLFGIGFAIQLARVEPAGASRSGGAAAGAGGIYMRRIAFLFVVGLVHASLLWPGDVLIVYAVLGPFLLLLRRASDGLVLVLLAACLLYPAFAEATRPLILPASADALVEFTYGQLAASNNRAFGSGSFLDAVRETADVFAWSMSSRLGRVNYVSFAVQMATGMLAGFLLGRRGWPRPGAFSPETLRRARRIALVVAVVGPLLAPAAIGLIAAWFGLAAEADIVRGAATLATTLGRFALAALYALVVVDLAGRAAPPRWLAPLIPAGRMPLSNYLLQTFLASLIFYGWGLGLWGKAGAFVETALAIALYFVVQLPLSSLWLRRFRQGPLESVWRRFTYG
jgi:uncharacterized protein